MPGRPITGQTGEIPGPKRAQLVPNPEVVISFIKKAERPLMVVGSEAPGIVTRDGNLIDTSVRLLKGGKVTVVATGHMVAEFRKRGAEGAYSMQLMNLGDRLRDTKWMGLDGKGPYDLVVFAGFPYYLEWLVLSGLKNFAQGLRTISLDNTYQPNAEWSVGMMVEEEWKDFMGKLVGSTEVDG